MSKAQKLTKCYITAYNQFDIDGMLSYVDEKIIFINYSGGKQTAYCQTKEEFHHLAIQSANLFAKRTQNIRNMIENDEQVAVEIDYCAILKQDLSSELKAGQELVLAGVLIFTFKDFKITKLVDYS
ncbi:nuclear transport factor 2 family protein [Legionella gresilensis]|uniref:nuclear transport factor 2 family protein n=1 Tax=Legionella gresilensis TaxID=91823 RepID=UPI001040ED83|nr:nuclear transport factor 2 family protein [Legionella gresilensis]